MNVSVVMATRNREALLRETIADALAQEPLPAEIVVVDGTPEHEPETDAYLAEVAGRIRHLRHSRPELIAARALGLEAATGEVILFIDDDVALPPGFVAAHAVPSAGRTVGAVAGRVVVQREVRRPLAAPPPPTGQGCDRVDRRDVAFGRGCNVSFRRAALLAAGGFDQRLTGNPAADEEDACFAVRRLGSRSVVDPAAWLIHRYAPTGGIRAAVRDQGDDLSSCRNTGYFASNNVGGLDFWRVLWNTCRTSTLSDRARRGGLGTLARRQALFWRGAVEGVRQFRRSGQRRVPLPSRRP
ncbi:MAG: glycosyltransferase family 2 protein [Chloroflexota bacterium]|nr:glycosyltransferase [Dehalococcoidia bacterium]MDW8254702.1 glycosyltransferase family 2 protein [Chloroflexota bacterium]